MKILVCIKQVPDTAEVKLDPKTGTLIRDGVPSIINHDDKAGLEAALKLRDEVGGTVSVVCMGPPQADVALREALAMGADEAYLLSAREFGGSDTYATATIIATALKKIGYDFENGFITMEVFRPDYYEMSTEENIKTAAAETARHIQRYCK